MDELEKLREEIFARVREYYQLAHVGKPFAPGATRVQYAGRVFDERELVAMTDAVLEFWLTAGRYAEQFERDLGAFLGAREVIPVNSGSSANLLAVTALCSPQLHNHLQPGDEVITPATTFPTTLAPIVQNRLVPVLVDCELGTYNMDVEQFGAALSERTRAIFIPHTLGNPAPMDRVLAFAREHNLFLIEDTCDALGSTYDGKLVGTFGQFGTLSFYPAHHITMGEGGALLTSSPPLYDHRYYFTEIGYNLKITDIQAALGVAQLQKLPDFIAARKRNFRRLYEGLGRFEQHLILPTWLPRADPSWFAIPLTVRDEAPFRRAELMSYLEARQVETRVLFGGNILKQPGYRDIQCRVVGDLPNSEYVLRGSFFIGVYPGLDEARIDYVLQVFEDFVRRGA